jgi:release factor glutamine methyltransferase
MTTLQSLQSIQKELQPVSGEFALPEAERILTFLLNCSRSELYLPQGKELPPGIAKKTQTVVKRRLKDEPLAHILGSAYFYNREFIVTPDVLIPRPDTEILVEEIYKSEPRSARRFLDFSTGSGCIAAVLTEKNSCWKAVATDISIPALKIARRNCPKNIPFLCCDRLSAIKNGKEQRFDFIVSNPPYIKSRVVPTLDKSVRGFEPLRALDGGPDGLDFYRYLSTEAPPLLMERGRIYCEIGYDQGNDVPEIFSLFGWKNISVTNDLGKRPRVLRAIKPHLPGRDVCCDN